MNFLFEGGDIENRMGVVEETFMNDILTNIPLLRIIIILGFSRRIEIIIISSHHQPLLLPINTPKACPYHYKQNPEKFQKLFTFPTFYSSGKFTIRR